jgi:hypothetical protein
MHFISFCVNFKPGLWFNKYKYDYYNCIDNHYYSIIRIQYFTAYSAVKNDNSDLENQLSSQFIKGYVNHRSGIIVKNPDFDPLYNSPNFLKNIDLLKS